MPAPATVDEFVDLIRKSAVLEEARLSAYVQKLQADSNSPKDLSTVAGLFVRDGLLTFFQAEQFLQGKWKRFTIGKYKVLERLGSGGMGQVFLCEHKLMRRRVAVKVLPTQKAADPSSLDRFYREARAVAALDHPNIVRAYDIDQDDNLHFLVMEYVDGASLQEMVRKSGPLDPTRACHYMYWSAVGLQHAHQQGLIHRDIKPGNILVDRQGVVKILDLGLARFFHDEDDLLTKKYDESVLGTADYLAPEQAVDSHTVDGRADIYSLGATFYFLLTGQPPFAEGTVAQKLLWHQSKSPKPVREARPEVPDAVAKVVAKMMAKKPEDRYQTPGELAEALLPFTQTPIPPPPESEMPTLSAAAQAVGGSAPSVTMNAPRTLVGSAPRTPPPAPMPPRSPASGGSKPPAPKPAAAGPKGNVALADADTQRNKAVPTVEPIPPTPIPDLSPGAQIWESISAETANNARADTDRTRRDGSSRRVKAAQKSTAKAPAAKSGRLAARRRLPRWVILAIVGGLLLVGAAAAAILLRGPKDNPSKSTNTPSGPRSLIVAKGGGNQQFASVEKALAEFKPGDTIVLQDDVEESIVKSQVRGLTIAAADGKKITWRAPAGKSSDALLSLAHAEGVKISGITFDAGANANFAVRLSGNCAGLILENNEFLNAKVSSLCLHDCTGDGKGRSVVVRKCRVAGRAAKCGIQFDAASPPRPGNQSITIESCMVDGPDGGAAIEFDGSATCEIRQCRVFQGAAGVRFRKAIDRPASDLLWQVSLVGNTFHSQSAAGLWVEDAGQVKSKPANKITLAYNFFAEAGPAAAIRIDGDAANQKFLVIDPNNARKKGTPVVLPGNFQPQPQLAEVPADVIVDPANPARNLTYEKNSPLYKAAGGKPVGAPPE